MNTARSNLGSAGDLQDAALAFGGQTTVAVANTESYDGATWTEVNDLNTARRQSGSGGTQTSALNWGGYGNPAPPVVLLSLNESWNGTCWSEVADLNTARRALSNGNGADNTNALAVGGLITFGVGSTLNESWNGTSWTELADLNEGRYFAASVGTNTVALAFGGDPGSPPNATTATESWNGTSWTTVSGLNTGRRGMAGSGTASLALGFGGISVTATVANAETWNGSSWAEDADLNLARSNLGGSGTQTSAVAFGGGTPSGEVANTEEFTKPGFTVKTITSS
jgi:hypothetical protein